MQTMRYSSMLERSNMYWVTSAGFSRWCVDFYLLENSYCCLFSSPLKDPPVGWQLSMERRHALVAIAIDEIFIYKSRVRKIKNLKRQYGSLAWLRMGLFIFLP